MSLRAVLLITLQREPGTGYDVLQRFRTGLAHVWQASHQQIYRELDKMHREQLLSCQTVAQYDKPDRKVYHITSEGIAFLESWLASPLGAQPVRSPLFAKFFVWERWPADARHAELASLRNTLEERMDSYQAIESAWFSSPDSLHPHERAPWHTLRLGKRLTQTWLAWIDEVLEEDREAIS